MSIAKPKVFWPLTVTAANRTIKLSINGTGGFTATIATGTYYSAVTLGVAVKAALDALASGVFTVTPSATGHFVISINAGSFTLEWSNVLATAYAILGWTAVDTTDAASLTATNQHPNGWYSDVAARFDSLPIRDRSADVVTVTSAGQTKFISEVELARREIRFQFLKSYKTFIQYETTHVNEALERWWQDGQARFRYWPDGTVEGTSNDYVFDVETIREFLPARQQDKKAIYDVRLFLRGFVA